MQLQGKNIDEFWGKPEFAKNTKKPKLEKTIAVVFKKEKLYIKFTLNEDELQIGVYVDELCNEECVNLRYYIDDKIFLINSILFKTKKDSPCRGTPKHILSGTFYIEFIMSLIFSLHKMGLDINICQLEDAAFILNPLLKQNVSLSTLKLFDDCRTFYEGYGFLPSLGFTSNTLNERTDFEFLSDEYINALRILVNDRIIFFSKPIHRVLKLIENKQLFRINDEKLLAVNIYNSDDDYNLVKRELTTLFHNLELIDKLDTSKLSLNDIFELATSKQGNSMLLGLIIGFLSFPVDNLTGDQPYYFPIKMGLKSDKLDRIFQIYSKKHIHIYEKPIRALVAAINRP